MVSLKASFPTAKWTTVLQRWGYRKVTSLVGGGGTWYSKLKNRRNPELGKVPTRFNLVFQKPNKGNNKITELRTILQRESQNS